jgi:hypothetical protein
MVMTILIRDAKSKLETTQEYREKPHLHVQELLYADDTLVVDADERVVSQYMALIDEAGAQYGLYLNWKKLEVLPVRCTADLPMPDGTKIKVRQNMKYLGSTLASDGQAVAELTMRLGAAEADFRKLKQIWSHGNISKPRKLQIYYACVVSKLMYCLHTVWLNDSETRRLDAFHLRCLRRIAGIGHSYFSRVSNRSILSSLKCHMLSLDLKKRRLLYIAELARKPSNDVLRSIIFQPDSLDLKVVTGPRKRGRPRTTWAGAVLKEAEVVAGDRDRLKMLWANTPGARELWDEVVQEHVNNPAKAQSQS